MDSSKGHETGKVAIVNIYELSTQIGLRNSKAIMERHSGNLEIIDAKDTFEVVLRFPVI